MLLTPDPAIRRLPLPGGGASTHTHGAALARNSDRGNAMTIANSVLLTDLYQLAMLQTYQAERMQETAVFELFVRRLPPSAASCWPPDWNRRWTIWKPCASPRTN